MAQAKVWVASNFLGQQIIRRLTQTGETIHALHDAAGNRIAEYDYDESAFTSTLIREYIWVDGMVMAVVEAGQMYFMRTDHIGRPVFVTDDSGAVVWEASSLPFGGVQTSTGANSELRFPGQWFQSETGLHQNWMRDYDPTTGRYIQADPLGLVDGASVYGYALQNPGRYTDPTGEIIPAIAACFANPVCRAAAAGGAMMLYGWLTDEDCYTWQEAVWDFGIGASLAAPHWWFNPGRNVRGGGVRLWKDGPGIDWHRFGLGARGSKRMVNRPHFHAGSTRNQMKKHRPWQGGWTWW